MTILTEPLYGIAYCDPDTALTDLATVSQQAATTTAAALQRGGVVPPGAADLTAEASTRANADTALSNRITALEGPPAWQPLTLATGWANYTGAATFTTPGGGPYQASAYRAAPGGARMRGWIQTTAAVAAGSKVNLSALLAAFRPSGQGRTLWPVGEASPFNYRFELHTDGFIYTVRALASGVFLNLDQVSWTLP